MKIKKIEHTFIKKKNTPLQKTLETCVLNKVIKSLIENASIIKLDKCVDTVTGITYNAKGSDVDDGTYSAIRQTNYRRANNERRRIDYQRARLREDKQMQDFFALEYPNLNPKALELLRICDMYKPTIDQGIHMRNFLRMLHEDYEYTEDMEGKQKKVKERPLKTQDLPDLPEDLLRRYEKNKLEDIESE